MNASNPVFPLETSVDWYRHPSVTVAFAFSLLAHAAAIALLPGLRVPKPIEPPPIVVELVSTPVVATPAPMPLAAPAPLPVVQPPPPAQKKQAEPPPPLPIIRQALEPEPPKPKSPTTPPAEIHLPPQPEPRPEAAPQPLPETQVEAKPQAQPYIEPQAEVRVEPAPAPRVLTPAPVVPPPLAALDPSALKSYGSVLTEVIGKRKRYPRIAQLRGWQGTTELRLLVSSDGKLKNVTVAHSSGFDVLDQQAIGMVKESLPLPDVPQSLRGREFAINVPVAFRLE